MSSTPATTADSATPNVHPSLALPGLNAEQLQKLVEIRPGDLLLVTVTTKQHGVAAETEQGGGWGYSTYTQAPAQSWGDIEPADNVRGWGDDAADRNGEQQYLDTHQRPTVRDPVNLESSQAELGADVSHDGFDIEVVPLDDEQPDEQPTSFHEIDEASTEQREDVIESHNAPPAHISANEGLGAAHEELSLGGGRKDLDDGAHRDLDEAALALNEHVSEGESDSNANLDLSAVGSMPHPLQSDVVDNIISQHAAVPLNSEQNTQTWSNTAASTEEQFDGPTIRPDSITAANEHEQPEVEVPQGAEDATTRQEDISSVDVHPVVEIAAELGTLTLSSNAGSAPEYVPTHDVETAGGRQASMAEIETTQHGPDDDIHAQQDQEQHDSSAHVNGPSGSTQQGWTSSNGQNASVDEQYVQNHDDDAAHQVDYYGDDQAYNNEEQDYDDDDQGYYGDDQGYDEDGQGYNDDYSYQATHIHGYNAAGEPTRSILFGVAAVYKNADRQLMKVYLQPLNYKESVSMADSKTYRIYGNDVLVHDVAAFTIDDDLESFTQSFVAEDHVEYSIEVNPTGDHLRISHLQRTCPNSNCQEGYLSCLENLQDGIPDALPSLSPFRPLCPVCLGKDLMEEQVHLRRLMEANQLLAHNLSLAIEHVQKRSERRVLVWGVSEVFDEHEWGFDFDALRPSGSGNTTDGDYYDGDDIPWDQMHPDARDPNINIVERPASETAIAALPRVLLQDLPIETHESDESRPLCTICSGELGDDTVMMVMPCSHAFCECLVGWLRRQRSCPQCRTVIPGEEIQVVEESVGVAETNEDMLNANGDAAEAVGSGVTDGQTDFANSNQLDLMDAYTADVNTPEAQAGHVWSAREAITSTSVGPGTAEVQSSW